MTVRHALAAIVAAFALQCRSSHRAQGELVVYCTVQEEWCRPMVAAFEKATGIKVSDDAQELGRVLRADQGRGGQSRGRHLVGRHRRSASAGGRGRADGTVQVAEARRPAGLGGAPGRASKYRTVGVYAGALGYSYNTDQLKKKNIPEPKCWSDLTKPAFKDEIQVANPNSSGTSYTMLAPSFS
jgi:iron(III) transport system substrate-binding protein